MNQALGAALAAINLTGALYGVAKVKRAVDRLFGDAHEQQKQLHFERLLEIDAAERRRRMRETIFHFTLKVLPV